MGALLMTTEPLKISQDYLQRFIWTGRVMHIVDPTEPLPPGESDERRPALCGTKPWWPGAWWGLDEDAPHVDREKGANLPICRQCKYVIWMKNEANGSAGEDE